jgi:hypothetical protein
LILAHGESVHRQVLEDLLQRNWNGGEFAIGGEPIAEVVRQHGQELITRNADATLRELGLNQAERQRDADGIINKRHALAEGGGGQSAEDRREAEMNLGGCAAGGWATGRLETG